MYSHKRKHEKQDKRVGELYALQNHQQKSSSSIKNPQIFDLAAQLKQIVNDHNSSSKTNEGIQNKIANLPFLLAAAAGGGNSSNQTNSNDSSRKSSPDEQIDKDELKIKIKSKNEPQIFNSGQLLDSKFAQENDKDFELDETARIDMNTLQQPISLMQQVAGMHGDNEKATDPHASGTSISSTLHDALNQTGAFRNKGDDSWKKYITR